MKTQLENKIINLIARAPKEEQQDLLNKATFFLLDENVDLPPKYNDKTIQRIF